MYFLADYLRSRLLQAIKPYPILCFIGYLLSNKLKKLSTYLQSSFTIATLRI